MSIQTTRPSMPSRLGKQIAATRAGLFVVALSTIGVLGACSGPNGRTGTSSSAPPVAAGSVLAEGVSSALDFRDVSRDVDIHQPELLSRKRRPAPQGQLWADLDGDGWIDLVYMNHSGLSLYQNQGGERFVDRLAESGIKMGAWEYPQQGDRHGAGCADFDNDGDLDLYVAHGADQGETAGLKRDELLEHRGDFVFTDIAQRAGTLNASGRARYPVWLDVDADGWVDLYVGNFGSPNVFYRNRGDGTFEDATAEVGLDVEGAHPSWTDFDRDGDLDIFFPAPLRLLEHQDDHRFRDITSRAFPKESPPDGRGSAWGDFDDDGDPDVFVIDRNPKKSRLYRNRFDGIFLPYTRLDFDSRPGEIGTGAAWADFENDGDLDLFVATSRRLLLFENKGKIGFLERPLVLDAFPMPGESADLAFGDYDNDGDLDLALNALDRQYLFANLRGRDFAWLKVFLEGTTSHRAALGARIEVYHAGELRVTREYGGRTFRRSIDCGPAHIGLGDLETVEVRVYWPSGTTDSYENVSTRQTLHLVEGKK